MARTARDPRTARFHQHEAGTIHALSSNGRDIYTVTNTVDGEWVCTCAGYTYRATCVHSIAAAQRFAGFVRRPLAVIVPADDQPDPPAPAAMRPVPCQSAPAAMRPVPCQSALYNCACPRCIRVAA